MRDRTHHVRSCFLAATFVAAVITASFAAIPTTSGADSTTPMVQLTPSGGTVPAGSQFTVSWIPANVPLSSGQSLLAYELCYGTGANSMASTQPVQIPSDSTQSSFSATNSIGVTSDIYLRAIYGTTGTSPSIAPCAALALLPSAAHLTFTTAAASSPTKSINPTLPTDVPAPMVSRDPADGHLELGHRLKISWTPVPQSIDNGNLENTGYFVCWGDFALHGPQENITDEALSPGHTSARLTIFEPFTKRQDVYVYAMYSPPGTRGSYSCRQLPKIAPVNIGHTTYVVDFPALYKTQHYGGCRSGTFTWTPQSIGTGGVGWGYFGNSDILVNVSDPQPNSATVEFLYDTFPTGADVQTNQRSFHLTPGKNWVIDSNLEPSSSGITDNERYERFSVSYSNCGPRPKGFHDLDVINAPAFASPSSCRTVTVSRNFPNAKSSHWLYSSPQMNFDLYGWSDIYHGQFWDETEPANVGRYFTAADALVGWHWKLVEFDASDGGREFIWYPPNRYAADVGYLSLARHGPLPWAKRVVVEISNCPPSKGTANTTNRQYWANGDPSLWEIPNIQGTSPRH